ncbi:MAG: sigma-54-dependent Fis family transcriptional regulator, partial [Deltaproteobacteria bacterium]|nr:sigma-54-dependent Fis family transcriptional regulator [Deltaproteobacteria bacterium]
MKKVTDGNELSPGASFAPLLDRDKLLKSIFRISSSLTAPSNVNKILKKILNEVVDTIGFDMGIIRLMDETKKYLETKVVKNYNPEEVKKAFSVALNLDEHDCISTKVAKSGQPIAIEDAATDPRITETDRMLTKIYNQGSIVCAPLKIGDEVIGTIAAWCKEETKFFPEEISLFLTFANQMSIIIHSTRLFETNAEKIRELMILQEAVSEINISRVLDNRILDILNKSALKIAKADKVLVYFLDIEKDRCLVMDSGKVFIEDKRTYDDKIGKSIIKEAIDTDAIVVRRESSDATRLTIPVYDGYLSEIAFPLHIKDKFNGALYLAKRSGGYSQDQVNILDVLVKNAVTSYDNAIMHSVLSLEAKTLKTEVEKLKEREDILLGFHNILGKSKKMQGLFHVVEEVAAHNTNILIQGESGTGKELIARAIHRQSNRNAKFFVDVNCAAIPGTLLESELFGYEAGAFTDARKRKIGLLEYANGGTLLLDEVGDMSIHLQVKFLRMLENGYIRRLGGTENIPVDVRFVFSTNRDLSQMVNEGLFREDLFYRIRVVPIMIPPLRERGDDIILLARYYTEEFNKKFGKKVKGFSKDAEQVLKSYFWPGNVRELKNIIERVMILQNIGNIITPENLPAEIQTTQRQKQLNINIDDVVALLSSDAIDYTSVTQKIITEIKEKILENALEISGGNKTVAAKHLSISRFKLIREQKKIDRQIN